MLPLSPTAASPPAQLLPCLACLLPAHPPCHLQDRREDAGYAKERASGAAENVKDAVKVSGPLVLQVALVLLAGAPLPGQPAWLPSFSTTSMHRHWPFHPSPSHPPASARCPTTLPPLPPTPAAPRSPCPPQDGYESAKGTVGNTVDTVTEAASDLGNTISVSGWVQVGGLGGVAVCGRELVGWLNGRLTGACDWEEGWEWVDGWMVAGWQK